MGGQSQRASLGGRVSLGGQSQQSQHTRVNVNNGGGAGVSPAAPRYSIQSNNGLGNSVSIQSVPNPHAHAQHIGPDFMAKY